MTDLFADRALAWDALPLPQQVARSVGPAVLARLPLSQDDTVLDFGAGTGLLTGHIAPRVAHVLAVDVSPAMLAQLEAKPELAGRVTTRCVDVTTTPIDERFSRVVSAMAMHHVADIPALLAALHAVLTPGGRIALADLDVEEGDFHPPGMEGVFHHGFARDALAEELGKAGFVDIDFDTACTVARDGKAFPIFLVTARRAASHA